MSTLNVATLTSQSGVRLPTYTSSTRPSNPENGLLIYNTTTNNVEYWNGSAWSGFTRAASISATGGTITTSGVYKIHTFTGDGTFTVTSASQGATIEIMVLGGGGAGGSDMGGGGGAGGLVYNPAFPISSGSYTCTVGGGGTGFNDYGNSPRAGSNGGNSVFGNSLIIAYGGGGGSSGHYYNPGEWAGIAGPQATQGGCGGGGSASYRSFNPDYCGGRPPGLGTAGQGFQGGYGSYCQGEYYAGGGGGTGALGQVHKWCAVRPGIGGPGTYLGITGTNYYWGGGGGGAGHNGNGQGIGGLGGGGGGGRYYTNVAGAPGGTGGLNVGGSAGNSGPSNGNGGAGGTNTGSGGGGGCHYQGYGGNGGSGIIVIRYIA
jgi:hypothetical protein